MDVVFVVWKMILKNGEEFEEGRVPHGGGPDAGGFIFSGFSVSFFRSFLEGPFSRFCMVSGGFVGPEGGHFGYIS